MPADPSRLLAHLHALEGERHALSSPAQLAAAQRYVADQLAASGWPITLHAFEHEGRRFENVLARSVSEDARRLIVAAHFDSVQGSAGADDNASGVAAMLEIARVIGEERPTAAVEFVGFNLEEWGMLGSRAYAADLKRRIHRAPDLDRVDAQ